MIGLAGAVLVRQLYIQINYRLELILDILYTPKKTCFQLSKVLHTTNSNRKHIYMQLHSNTNFQLAFWQLSNLTFVQSEDRF